MFHGCFASVIVLDIFAVGYAQHRIMRVEKVGFGKKRRIGRNQRQVVRISHVDQSALCGFLNRITATAELDIQTL